MLNPFFLNGSKTEQNLVQSLVNEQLRMYGIEVYYLPRRYVTTNTVIKEVIQSDFTNAYPIEAYVDNYEGYTGQGSILSKFGIENRDDLQLVISKERYENYITPLIKDIPDIELSTRPKEGDLIYFPLGDRLFEIKFVEHEQPFYQLKKTYVYELRCELFRYEDEVIDTGIADIDDEIAQIGYIQTLALIGAGRSATATAQVCPEGAVSQVTITNMGKDYVTPPQVGFSSAPPGGITATGIASLSYNYPNCNGIGGRISAIHMTDAGCGYEVAPWVSITGDTGVGAAATTGISTDGSIRTVTVTDGGSGYIKAPKVSIGLTAGTYPLFSDTNYYWDSSVTTFDSFYPSPSRYAVGLATISAGIVTAIYIIDGGSGYDTNPVVIIDPPFVDNPNISVGGMFVFNEIVTGSVSGTTARVKEWNGTTNIIEISIVSGSFVPQEYLTGSTSGARYVIGSVNTDDLVTPFADNDNIEAEAKTILDFSTSNPFGMP